jgi:hypothetical protein
MLAQVNLLPRSEILPFMKDVVKNIRPSGHCFSKRKDYLMHAKIPLWLKLAYTAFMAVLVPVYLQNYGATNFLYFCDIALFLTLVGIWLESPLILSIPAVGIIAPQVLWNVDLVMRFFGSPISGVTEYMFDSTKSLFLRSLSLFHGWIPFFLFYAVYRVGYDKRAFPLWVMVATSAILVSYFFLPPPEPNPGDKVVNVNYVFGIKDTEAQTWMHPHLWVACVAAIMATFALVTHFPLKRLAIRRGR